MKFSNLKYFILFTLLCNYSCSSDFEEKNKIFHAGPNESGLGGTYFSLYKGSYYKFCDGDFLNPGCYTGKYKLNGDTLTLEKLKLNDHVKSNRFIIYRFNQQDSSYWKNKYPNSNDWSESRESDSLRGFEGDIYELDKNNQPQTNVNSWYVIRFDKMK